MALLRKKHGFSRGKAMAGIMGLTFLDVYTWGLNAAGVINGNAEEFKINELRAGIDKELIDTLHALRNDEFQDRLRAIRENTTFRPDYSRLDDPKFEHSNNPVTQAVQDSYVTMEEFQKAQREGKGTGPEQDEYFSHLTDQSSHQGSSDDDDFQKQILEAERENNKWKKKKWGD